MVFDLMMMFLIFMKICAQNLSMKIFQFLKILRNETKMCLSNCVYENCEIFSFKTRILNFKLILER